MDCPSSGPHFDETGHLTPHARTVGLIQLFSYCWHTIMMFVIMYIYECNMSSRRRSVPFVDQTLKGMAGFRIALRKGAIRADGCGDPQVRFDWCWTA